MRFDFLLSELMLGYNYRQHERSIRALQPAYLHEDCRGLSGSEVNALGLANALTTLGHTVRIFTHCSHTTPSVIPCEWHFLKDGPVGDPADVVIAFHDSLPLQEWFGDFRIVWHQTITPPHYELMGHENVDLYISATEHNRRTLEKYTGDTPWAVVPNGWDFGPYRPPDPVSGRLFYHTSAERGLHVLLTAFPHIKDKVPDAHLVIWSRLETCKDHHKERWAIIEPALERLAPYIELHPEGGSRSDVLASLATAACVAYPSEPDAPCEVMPVSVMEALATGVPVVTSPSDQFQRAFTGAVLATPWPPSVYLQTFANRVVGMLRDTEQRMRYRQRGLLWADGYRFEQTVQRFLAVLSYRMQTKGVA